MSFEISGGRLKLYYFIGVSFESVFYIFYSNNNIIINFNIISPLLFCEVRLI